VLFRRNAPPNGRIDEFKILNCFFLRSKQEDGGDTMCLYMCVESRQNNKIIIAKFNRPSNPSEVITQCKDTTLKLQEGVQIDKKFDYISA
jgi:hypothetical protein